LGEGGERVVTSEATISHTYAAADTYTVSLTVSDGIASDTQTTTVEVTSEPVVSTLHVGDLDGQSSVVNKKKWAATVFVTVLDESGAPVPNATVEGSWSTGLLSSVTTNADGLATVSSGTVDNGVASVTFTVTNIVHASLGYDPDANTDPDGDSSGTAIVVFQDGATQPPASLLAAGSLNLAGPATAGDDALAASDSPAADAALLDFLAADQLDRSRGRAGKAKNDATLADLALGDFVQA
jgi:PKD repeat protein